MDRDDDGSNPFTNNIVVLLLAMGSAAFVVSLYHLIVLCCCGHRNTDDQNPPQQHHNQQQEPGELAEPSTSNSVAHLIPSHKYHKKNVTGGDGSGGGGGAATCAVCLGDFEEGEELKTLPECVHSFHVSCIDMWLHSHASCPVCRASATPSPAGLHHGPSNLLPPDFGHGDGGGGGGGGLSSGQHHGIDMVQITVVQNGFVRR